MNKKKDTLPSRHDLIGEVKRVVIKIGSSVLTAGSDALHKEVFKNLAKNIAFLKKDGYEIIVVSSGAVAAGRKSLACIEQPVSIPQKQAAAAVGQVRLMRLYEDCFNEHNCSTAQVLLTHDALSDRQKFLNARNTLFTLLQCGIIPIINENDSVVVDEIKFGDNDILSALATNLVDADLLLILTDRDGLCAQDPQRCENARLIKVVEKITKEIETLAQGSSSKVGTGGMISKVDAAKKVSIYGIPTIVVNGNSREIINRVFKGEDVGTLFLPRKTKLSSRKHWIAFNLKPKGTLVVDDGAKRAIVEKGKSLLSTGLIDVQGFFKFGDPVKCVDTEGFEFARGLVNYRAEEVVKLRGVHSRDIKRILGYKYYDEIIHRDDLVVLEDE
jgi:glutamate 5-kinase